MKTRKNAAPRPANHATLLGDRARDLARAASRTLRLAALAGAVALATACGGGGGDNPAPAQSAPPSQQPAAVDVSGRWQISENGTSNCPGEATFTDSYQISITQQGSSLSVTTPAGTFSGVLNGRDLSWTGSYPEDGGTTTITSLSATIAADNNSFTGSASWTWSNGTQSCSGRTDPFRGSRTAGAAPDRNPPTTPGGLTAQASRRQIDLNWTASTDDTAVAHYVVFHDAVSLGTQNATSYRVTGLADNTRYCFTVQAVDAAGNTSAQSTPACAITPAEGEPPSVPANVRAQPVSASRIDLLWDASNDNVGVISYNVYQAAARIATATSTRAEVGGLSPATRYCFTVTALDAAGNESPASAEACATTLNSADITPPTVPSGLTATAVSSSQINLAWRASIDDVGVTGYQIFRDGTFLRIETGTTASITGLAPSTRYCIEVTAFDAADNKSARSTQVCAATPAATDPPPSVPQNLRAEAASSSSIKLAWAASTDNVGVTGYRIYRGGVFLRAVNELSAVDDRLNANTRYCYQVLATDAAGNESARSAEQCATTLPAGPFVTALDAVHDNLVMISSTKSTVADTVYSNGELAIGCNWVYSATTRIQDFVCAQSLVRFDTAALAGRTIDSAKLTLRVNYLGVGTSPRDWHIRALTTPWQTATVTWNKAATLQYYTASQIVLAQPTSRQTVEVDITQIVRAWVNGTYANHGLVFGWQDYTFPYATSYDAFSFFSREDSAGGWPKATITYR